MQFEWDEAKNIENIRKHEIDFADVSLTDGHIFFDTMAGFGVTVDAPM